MIPRLASLAALFVLAASPVFADSPNPASNPAALAQAQKLAQQPAVSPPRGNRIVDDHSGRKEEGKASFYAHSFDGRKMADGNRYDPNANVAASKSLPLGTVAKVTNLKTDQSTTVQIEDRGPFVDGRVVDLTPHTAKDIGITPKAGVAPVVVEPIAVPQRDGGVKLGAGAATSPPAVTQAATQQAAEAAGHGAGATEEAKE